MRNAIIAVLLIAVLGGGAFYFWSESQDEDYSFDYDEGGMTEYDQNPQVEAVPTSSETPSDVAGYITYTSGEHGFSMDYPEAWTKDETSTLVPAAFYSPSTDAFDLFQENVNVTTEDTTYYGAVTLSEYSDAGFSNIQSALPEYVLIDQGLRTFGKGNYEGAYLLGDYTVSGVSLRIYSLFTLVDGTAYVITYTYEDSQSEAYQATADAMVASFQIGS